MCLVCFNNLFFLNSKFPDTFWCYCPFIFYKVKLHCNFNNKIIFYFLIPIKENCIKVGLKKQRIQINVQYREKRTFVESYSNFTEIWIIKLCCKCDSQTMLFIAIYLSIHLYFNIKGVPAKMCLL